MGMMQAQSITAKSTKRLSIGSLPQSLANIEPFNVSISFFFVSIIYIFLTNNSFLGQ
jgi:hypothetical protein